jgi:mRNA interferase MazF
VRRGDLVIVAAPGDYGKPRPAVVIQTDMLNHSHASILVCLLSSDIQDAPLFRIDVDPGDTTGLAIPSQIMADKIVALKRNRITQQIGRLDDATMLRLNRSLAFCIGLA